MAMSKKKFKKRIKIDHSQCECMVQQRGPHWGLFCVPHGAYIKWLSRDEQDQLRELDIPWISQSKPSEDIWDTSPWL